MRWLRWLVLGFAVLVWLLGIVPLGWIMWQAIANPIDGDRDVFFLGMIAVFMVGWTIAAYWLFRDWWKV